MNRQYNLIIGDFNIDLINSTNVELMTHLLPNYTQLVREETTDYHTLLDHAYTNMPSTNIQCYTSEAYFTDHKPILITIPRDDS